MPIYEFHCKECREDFKTLRRAEKLDSVSCPACESPKVVRLLSVTANAVPSSGNEGACAMPSGGGACCGGGCGCR